MGGFRHFIIKTAEVVTILSIIFFTIAGAIWGAAGAALGGYSWIVGLLTGAISGFALTAVGAAVLFLLVEIAENTKTRVGR
jgi:hypothetical protein